MITEIIHEVEYWFWLVVIVAFGMCSCDIGNREALWEDKYQNWIYITDCHLPDGFLRAMIDPDKCN